MSAEELEVEMAPDKLAPDKIKGGPAASQAAGREASGCPCGSLRLRQTIMHADERHTRKFRQCGQHAEPEVRRPPIFVDQSAIARAAWPKQQAVQVHRRPAGEARDLTVQLRQRAAAWLLCAVQAAAPAAKACCRTGGRACSEFACWLL